MNFAVAGEAKIVIRTFYRAWWYIALTIVVAAGLVVMTVWGVRSNQGTAVERVTLLFMLWAIICPAILFMAVDIALSRVSLGEDFIEVKNLFQIHRVHFDEIRQIQILPVGFNILSDSGQILSSVPFAISQYATIRHAIEDAVECSSS